MKRIIINNKTHKEDKYIMRLVFEVMNRGKVSNNNTRYCYCTVIRDNVIYAKETKTSIIFDVVIES
jgi:hypothetical protein